MLKSYNFKFPLTSVELSEKKVLGGRKQASLQLHVLVLLYVLVPCLSTYVIRGWESKPEKTENISIC